MIENSVRMSGQQWNVGLFLFLLCMCFGGTVAVAREDDFVLHGSWTNYESPEVQRLPSLFLKLANGDYLDVVGSPRTRGMASSYLFELDWAPPSSLVRLDFVLATVTNDTTHSRAAQRQLIGEPRLVQSVVLAVPPWTDGACSHRTLTVRGLESTAVPMLSVFLQFEMKRHGVFPLSTPHDVFPQRRDGDLSASTDFLDEYSTTGSMRQLREFHVNATLRYPSFLGPHYGLEKRTVGLKIRDPLRLLELAAKPGLSSWACEECSIYRELALARFATFYRNSLFNRKTKNVYNVVEQVAVDARLPFVLSLPAD